MKIQKFKITGKSGLFGYKKDREKLSALGKPLKQRSGVINFEMFRPVME